MQQAMRWMERCYVLSSHVRWAVWQWLHALAAFFRFLCCCEPSSGSSTTAAFAGCIVVRRAWPVLLCCRDLQLLPVQSRRLRVLVPQLLRHEKEPRSSQVTFWSEVKKRMVFGLQVDDATAGERWEAPLNSMRPCIVCWLACLWYGIKCTRSGRSVPYAQSQLGQLAGSFLPRPDLVAEGKQVCVCCHMPDGVLED